ncbi:DUF1996 domain-containing protein [Cupriavidus sp. BIS7]|uniref:DUF1996 domain-containing protein n=1 Tax=Cupriavidus sp. BIS7 TaxID=1217718 RepID=UPI00031A6614|nr:DUF1996 domain-containing protein [Cupriavidus sp. BIS7]
MKTLWIHACTVLCGLLLAAAAAAQTPKLTDGSFDIVCNYSHTLPDDAIVYPGKPGIAMQHDFFGNTTTNAYSTADTLQAVSGSTCENAADGTAYWAPSLKLPDGTIVRPSYQKTYYTNQAVPSAKRVYVQALPAGLKMMVGDHHGTQPNPRISFLCTGRGYTNTIPTNCVPDPATGTQLNIGMNFPTCWDGVNLSPVMGGHDNMAYPDSNGKCPSGYPVHLPEVNMNIAYNLGQISDLTNVQLSLDPQLDAQGNVVKQLWGSLYTAHGDFFMGWRPQAAQYMATYCMNKGRVCNRELPYSYSEPSDDATVVVGSTANYGTAKTLNAQRSSGSTPESVFYVKFKIPQGAVTLPPEFTPRYMLLVDGGNMTDTAAVNIGAFSVSTDWSEQTINGTNAPACQGTESTLYLNNQVQYRTFTVTDAINQAIAAGKDTVAFCVRGTGDGRLFQFGSKESVNRPVLYMIAVNPLPT